MATQVESDSSQDTVFKQLDSYDWEKDKEFQGGLSAILGPSSSPSQVQELTLRAKCFYFTRKKGVTIDFDAYKAHSISKSSFNSEIITSSTTPDDVKSQTPDPASTSSFHPPTTSTPTSNYQLPFQPRTTPQPQSYRTSRDLFSSPQTSTSPFGLFSQAQNATTSDSTTTPATTTTKSTSFQPSTDPASAPYPASFPDIVALIQSGAPIPGIVDVDPTVAWGQGSKPTMKARRKPYEMHLTEEQVQPGYWGATFSSTDSRSAPPITQELPDGEEPEFKGANWWRVVEERGVEKGKDGGDGDKGSSS